jgi:membrane protein implicated in regulation of membrane protease activity
MTGEQNRHNKIKDILPILWSSYEHIYDVRETSTTNGINYLMIVATFLSVFCLTLFMAFTNHLFLFPIFFQIVALLILLKRFFIKGQIPWLELKPTLSQLDDNAFESYLIATLKAAEADTWRRLGALNTIIKSALFLLIFSILLTSIASVFMLTNGFNILSIVLTILLVVVFSFFYFFFYKKTPESKLNDQETIYINEINNWLHEYERENNLGPDSATN